jgi:hypothetical protein
MNSGLLIADLDLTNYDVTVKNKIMIVSHNRKNNFMCNEFRVRMACFLYFLYFSVCFIVACLNSCNVILRWFI